MVQQSAGISEAAIKKLSKAIDEFSRVVNDYAGYAGEAQRQFRTIEEKPECDYMQYLRKTKVGKVRSRRK